MFVRKTTIKCGRRLKNNNTIFFVKNWLFYVSISIRGMYYLRQKKWKYLLLRMQFNGLEVYEFARFNTFTGKSH